jgi:cytoskeletal protein CcmA (bactofilin family)
VLKIEVMKKIGIVLSIVIFSFAVNKTYASDNASSSASKFQVVTLNGSQVVDHDYFAAGETVIISGTVKGDAYIAGGQVIIDGTIDGDLLVAGGTITVTGQVTQDIRALGGTILISGEVGRNLTLVGGNIDILPSAKIGGSLVLAGGNINLAAPITGDVHAVAGNLIVSNTVDGNFTAFVGQLTLTPKAQINGNLYYTSDADAVISPEATVGGILAHQFPKMETKMPALNLSNFRTVAPEKIKLAVERVTNTLFILSLLNSLVVGFLIVNFFPNFSYKTILSIEEHPWKTLGVGLMGLIIIPMIAVVGLVLIIGISLSAIIGTWFMLTVYLARIMFSYWLGARFIQGLHRMAGPSITFSVGIFLYYLLSAVTYVGPVIQILAFILGTGAILRSLRNTYINGRLTKVF